MLPLYPGPARHIHPPYSTPRTPAPGEAPMPSAHRDRLAARLLDSPIRQRIVRQVAGRPGQTVGELLETLDVGWGTLHHHLKRLEHAGLLHTVSAGRRRLVYPGPSAAEPPGSGRARAILRGRTARRVAEAIADHPGVGIDRLVPLVGESPRTVYYHVKRLVDAGLVLMDRATRYADLAPAPALARLLAQDAPRGAAGDEA